MAVGRANVHVVGMDGSSVTRENRLSLEAYDERANANAVAYTVTWNAEASRQDEFGEIHYPSVTLTHQQIGFQMSIRLHLLQEEVLAHTYKEENGVIKIIDKNILKDAEHLGRSPDRADALVIWNWVRERHREYKEPEPVDTHFNPEFNRNREAIRQRLFSGQHQDVILSEEEGNEWQAL